MKVRKNIKMYLIMILVILVLLGFFFFSYYNRNKGNADLGDMFSIAENELTAEGEQWSFWQCDRQERNPYLTCKNSAELYRKPCVCGFVYVKDANDQIVGMRVAERVPSTRHWIFGEERWLLAEDTLNLEDAEIIGAYLRIDWQQKPYVGTIEEHQEILLTGEIPEDIQQKEIEWVNAQAEGMKGHESIIF